MIQIPHKDFEKLYTTANDTVDSWVTNNLILDSAYEEGVLYTCQYKLDSTICINSSQTKMIGKLLKFNGHLKKYFTDGLEEFYGAKIKGKWYFWSGGYTPVSRSAFKGHDPKKPLSYKQLHSLVGFGAYLKADGSVNDAWFERKFKSGRTSFKERYKYEYILNGQRVDNERDYWEYQYKQAGLILWTRKAYNDSIVAYSKNFSNPPITDEIKRSIGMAITTKFVMK